MSSHPIQPSRTNTAKLTKRVTTYLNRHIAWLQENLYDLQELDPDQPTRNIDTHLQHQQQRENQIKHLLREHHALLREWQEAKPIDPTHIATVQKLAAQAENLTQNLRTRFEETVHLLEQSAASNKESLQATRQGRDLLKKYRPGGDHLAGFIDKKA